MEQTAYAGIPTPVETIESPVANRVQEELQTPRVLFFAGDALTDTEKRNLPFMEPGGIYLPDVKCLRSTKGMLYKCALTLLPPFRMIPDAKAMLGPNRAQLEFQDSFTQTIVGHAHQDFGNWQMWRNGRWLSRETVAYTDEVSDVATATIMGVDVVMLSDETANGNYPVETVAAVRRTIMHTQENWSVDESVKLVVNPDELRRDAISRAAVSVAEEIGATAIIAETKTGATAANIAACRPHLPIVAVTSDKRAAQQLALTYAMRSFVRPDGEKAGSALAVELHRSGYFGRQDRTTVVIVSGRQPGMTGGTDTVRVRVIE